MATERKCERCAKPTMRKRVKCSICLRLVCRACFGSLGARGLDKGNKITCTGCDDFKPVSQ